MIPLDIFVLLLFLYSLVSRRLERTIVTAPIVFTVAGMLTFPGLQGILKAGFTGGIALRVAEVGLVMLLFTDASRTDLNVLRNIRNLPARLLSAGMLLTIFLGAVAARLVFPASLHLGSGNPERHSPADRRRPGPDHREQSARADAYPPGA